MYASFSHASLHISFASPRSPLTEENAKSQKLNNLAKVRGWWSRGSGIKPQQSISTACTPSAGSGCSNTAARKRLSDPVLTPGKMASLHRLLYHLGNSGSRTVARITVKWADCRLRTPGSVMAAVHFIFSSLLPLCWFPGFIKMAGSRSLPEGLFPLYPEMWELWPTRPAII